jgi:phage shock protein PspC (stress-responsive transcriptional regulator)
MVPGAPVEHRGGMSTTPPDTQTPPPGPDSGPRVSWDDVKDLGRLRRVVADRRVAGVAGGIARHLDIDPLLVRVGFVVLAFFGGVGLLLYLALWLLVPEDGTDWAVIKLDRRSRAVALVLIGVLALVLLVSHGWWGDPGPFLLLVAMLGVILVGTQLAGRDRHTSPPEGATTPPPAPSSTLLPADAPAPQPAPAPAYVVPEQPRPVNPRKKGPILFWFALATMVVALGVLAIVDLAGASVAPSAYPATMLGLSAAFLLIGSFFGRAGGLILVGLLAASATAGTTFADRWDPHREVVRPATAASVQSDYHLDVGELVVDLSGVSDPGALSGRTIHVSGGIGHLDIRVPASVSVVTSARVTGMGGITAFGRDAGGVDTTVNAFHAGAARGVTATPPLTIQTDLHIGAIDVHAQR